MENYKLLIQEIDNVFNEYKNKDVLHYLKRKNYIINILGVLDCYNNEDYYKLKEYSPKFYIHLRNKIYNFDGDTSIERIFVKTENELCTHLYKNPREAQDYTVLKHLKEHNQYEIKELLTILDSDDYYYSEDENNITYTSLLLTNDENILKRSLYAINLDELLKLYNYPHNKNKIRLNINSFNFHNELFSNVIKILSGYIISANTNYVDDVLVDNDKTYYGDLYCKGWEYNKNFEFLKQKNNSNDIGFNLYDYNKKTILFFRRFIKNDLFDVFSNEKYWTKTKKGYKFYASEYQIRIYIDSLTQLNNFIHNFSLSYINIKERIDNNLYVEYFIENYSHTGYLDPNVDNTHLFYEEMTTEMKCYLKTTKTNNGYS